MPSPKFVIGGVTVALEGAAKTLEEGLRACPAAPHLKVKDDRPARLAVFPKIGLMVAPGFFPGLHRHGGFIRLQIVSPGATRPPAPAPPRRSNSPGGQNGVGQRFAAQIHAVIFRQRGALAIDRGVLLVFLDQRPQ